MLFSKYLAEKKMTLVGDVYTFHLCTFQWSEIYGFTSLCNRNGAEIKGGARRINFFSSPFCLDLCHATEKHACGIY